MSEPLDKVAAIQMASSPNVHANLLEATRLIGEAVGSGARLVVLPENFAFMGENDRAQYEHREVEGEGPLQRYLSETARNHGIWLVGGTIPLVANDDSKVRAACLVYDDQGQQVARYDKIHLFDVHLLETDENFIESNIIEPGEKTVVIDTPVGRMGIAICYDLRFPEMFRAMLNQGMELVAVPAAFTAVTGKAHWDTLVRARAIENMVFVIAADQGGYHINGRKTYGHSMIVDPWGGVLAAVERGASCVSSEVDLEHQRVLRRNFPVIEHRRL